MMPGDRGGSPAELVVDAAEYALIRLDVSGSITSWNPGAELLVGYVADEIVGKHVAVLYPREDVEAGKPAGHLASARSGVAAVQPSLVSRHGARIPVQVAITAQYGAGRTLIGFDALLHERFERRVREADVREGEERFRLMVDCVMDYAILMLDIEGRIVTWNAGAERLKGYTAGEVLGRDFAILYTPEDVAAMKPLRSLEIALASGRMEDEGWRVRRDGTRFWANVVITALRNVDGSMWGFCKVTRDLTERREAEVAIRASEERFRRFFDDAPIGMMISDLEGRYQRVNPSFCALVGYPPERLVGLRSRDITHPGDVEGDLALLRRMKSGVGTHGTRDKRYVHALGHIVWASVSVSLIRDAAGQPMHLIAQAQDVTARRNYESQLEFMADHDPLTGLLNRRSFMRELNGHVTRIARYGAMGSILMIDLDNFKYFNDLHGHSAGDQLIVRIAEALRSRLRACDVLARLGGDEFAVLLPSGDEAGAHKVAEDLLQAIRDLETPALTGRNKWVTGSIGIARFDETEHPTAEEIMVSADLAMYDAKEDGRDRCARYRAGKTDRLKIERRMKWAERINDAIANDGFDLVAQPIVSLTDGSAPHYELLLRMRDGDSDFIPPGAFLYVAERLGLIGDIDRWVTTRAIDMLAEQRALGHDLCFEVNLSGLSIGDEELLDLVKHRLRETKVPPNRLIFEVTETAAVAHIGRAVRFVERLSTLGCGFALDDFGAGFGSFYYLKHLPFDYLKIDGEFVQNCPENATDRILISAVVQIAHDMGKRTVAEFVTRQETVEVLTRLGVDYGQGYHLGMPAPLAEHLRTRSLQRIG